jgi:hypothetical protein
MKYRKENGKFIFRVGGLEPHMVDEYECDEIAIGYFAIDCMACLIQHGPVEKVREWAKPTEINFKKAINGVPADVYIISSKDWNLEELNNIIHNNGKFVTWLRDRGIIDGP